MNSYDIEFLAHLISEDADQALSQEHIESMIQQLTSPDTDPEDFTRWSEWLLTNKFIDRKRYRQILDFKSQKVEADKTKADKQQKYEELKQQEPKPVSKPKQQINLQKFKDIRNKLKPR